MPGGLTCIHPWSVVGVVLLPVHHIKGRLECGHLSSVSHVLAIACTFALRESISLVFQAFPAQLYLSPCPAMWFQEYVWGSACETHSTFSLGVHALPKTHFHKAKVLITQALYTLTLVWSESLLLDHTRFVGLESVMVAFPIRLLSSLLMDRLSVMVDPRYTNSWTTSSL